MQNSTVLISEVGPRDGLQSVKATMPTAHKLAWIDGLYKAGLREMEVCSFVPAKLLPQMADAADVVRHALQHRGQEAVGIVSFDGQEFFARRGLGHVAQVFSDSSILEQLPGEMASGHVRYATCGAEDRGYAQPLERPHIQKRKWLSSALLAKKPFVPVLPSTN